MKTPKTYVALVKKGIITKTMLAECLFSVNKRAKNCRDKEADYRRYYRQSRYAYDKYGNEERYREKKQEYYRQKELLLSLVKPDCIHMETVRKRNRYYDYDKEYKEKDKKAMYRNHYYDYEEKRTVRFADVIEDVDQYYLFYDFGDYSFHTPIAADSLTAYPELDIIKINNLDTHGKDITELLSTQFVRKVIALIETGQCQVILD